MDFKDTKEIKEKSLPEIYKELQQARINSSKRSNNTVKRIKISFNKISINFGTLFIIAIFIIVILSSTKNIFASNSNTETSTGRIKIEENHEAIQIEEVISNNTNELKRKSLTTENRDIEFQTIYKENQDLPKDEQVIVQQGELGSKIETVVKTYSVVNGKEEANDEIILNTTITKYPVNQIIEVGTSELLGKFKVHIGDNLYTKEDVTLRELADENSDKVYIIGKYVELKVIAVEGDYVKVAYGVYTGYVHSEFLASEYTNPEYVEKCRIQKALNTVQFDMNVNKPSGLTLDDFKKVLSNNPRDVNKIFENNAENFYNAEQKYQVNGLLLAAIGIHESAWGTSSISKDKNNLFGYGAYDRDPYNSAFSFDGYQDGIETLAKALAKNYLNPAGLTIFGGETATGKYFNGTSIASINVRYATDENWGHAVFNIMEGLYEKLQQ